MSKEVVKQEKKAPSPGERFTNAVVSQFQSNPFGVNLTPFQQKLTQNYFIKIDSMLKEAERKRLAKSEQFRDSVELTWAYVNMNKLAIDVVAYSSVGLDPCQPNHISMIPFKNNGNSNYDIAFIIGYNGMELKARKYGMDVPVDVVIELVYEKDKFKAIKKDMNNKVEGYVFEAAESIFDRGQIIGGFWYKKYEDPEKNKLHVFSKGDIEKRKPKHASAEFWGGEKTIYEKGKATGKEEIEGWFEEMAIKTIKRHAYNSIIIDSEKIDAGLLHIMQNDNNNTANEVEEEILINANKIPVDFAEETQFEEQRTLTSENKAKADIGQQEANNQKGPGF